MMRWSALWLVSFAFGVFGCGDGDPETAGSGAGSLLPWAEGYRWTYRVTEQDGTVTQKVTEILPVEDVGGTGPNRETRANRVVTKKSDGMDETHSWQSLVGEKVVRYREISFDKSTGAEDLEEHWDPFKLRVDGSSSHTKVGTWFEEYEETKIKDGVAESPAKRRDLWQVVKVSEKVTVPAGEFEALVLQRTSGSDSTKQYFFVRGIGKVKETGAQIEELESYEIDP